MDKKMKVRILGPCATVQGVISITPSILYINALQTCG